MSNRPTSSVSQIGNREQTSREVALAGSRGPARTWRVRHERLAALLGTRRASRDRRQWSYVHLGATLGVSAEAIRKIVTGRTVQPDPRVITGLASLLDVPLNQIVDGHLPTHDGLDWIADDVLDGLRRLKNPSSQASINRALRRLLWVHSQPAPHSTPDTTPPAPPPAATNSRKD